MRQQCHRTALPTVRTRKYARRHFGETMHDTADTDEPASLTLLLQDEGKAFDLGVAARFISTSNGDKPVVDFLNWVFPYAASVKASDIHFRDQENGCMVRLRGRDMALSDRWLFSRAASQEVDEKIRAKCRIGNSDRESPQDGSFWLLDQTNQTMVDVRVSILPNRYGQSTVCRILNQENAHFGLDAVHMPDTVRCALEKVLSMHEGLILCCGPTGSGKSYTLNACLNHVNRPDIHVCTAEDPVEYPVKGANQISIHPVYRPFSKVIRSFMRHDPDVILVGEVRDGETAEMAVNAANTGHLVLTTIHANDAPLSLYRLMGLGVEGYMLADVLLAFFSQRLLNRLCPHCREAITLSEAEQPPSRFFQAACYRRNPNGCDNCRSGYTGRIPVIEFALNSPQVRQALLAHDMAAVREALYAQPQYRTLTEAALEMSAQGLVDFDDACAIGSMVVDKLLSGEQP